MKTFRFVLTLLAATAFYAAPASAGVIKFPKDAPVLSFELPEGWTATPEDKGNLKVMPGGDDEFQLMVARLDMAQDSDGPRKGLPVVARKSCEGCGAKGVEVTEVKTSKGVGKKSDLTLSACEARGKDDAGNEFVTTAATIEANGKFVLFVSITTDAKDKKYTPDMEKILDSMEKVK